MADYAAIGDIRTRLPNRTFDGTSKPSTAEVEALIEQTDAIVNGELAAQGFGVPIVAARGVEILTDLVATRVCGLVERAYQSTRNEDDDVGTDKIERFEAFLVDIRTNPETVRVKLGLATGKVERLSSQVTDRDDTIPNKFDVDIEW